MKAKLCYARLRDVLRPASLVDAVTADFYVSMGGSCRAVHQLRRNNLRICSSPLDWMTTYTLRDALELYRTGFSSFFSDIRELPYENDEMRKVMDVRNGMTSIHHFPKSLTLEEGRKAYKERAARHFANTHGFLSAADRFVMVTNRTESLADIREFVEGMSELYKADIVHVNVRNGTGRKRKVLRLPNGAVVYDYTVDDVSSDEKLGINELYWWHGNDSEWRRILRRCRRTPKFSPPERTSSGLKSLTDD